MAQNITLLGASYSDVPSVLLPKTGGGTASFTDVTDTTAAAADVASGKYFYTAAGVFTQGTASGGGSASNVVTGTVKGTTTGTAMDVTLNYSGSGHPIAVMVYPSDGPYKSGGTFYNLIQRYACNYWIAIKSNMSTSPAYSGGTTDKYCGYQYRKNSTSSSTTYTGTAFTDGSVADDIGAVTNKGNGIVRLRSKTKMSVYIADTSYGFAANIEYTYRVIYSS